MTAGLGLCEIWGGYVGNNVCPITCSMCDGGGASGAFCGCTTLAEDATFADAIVNPDHLNELCITCDLNVHASCMPPPLPVCLYE